MADVIKYDSTLPTLNADDSYDPGEKRSLIYKAEFREMNQEADHTIIYLFRHGEAIEDEMELFGGWNDSPLTEHGREAAEEAAAFLAQYKFGTIYVDDLARTLQTAEILLPYSQTAIELVINSMARTWGIGDALSGKPKNPENEAIKDRYVKNPDLVPEGGNAESLNQSRRRWMQFLTYVVSQTPVDMPSVIVCHSGNIKTTTDTFGTKIKVKPSGIVALHITEHGIQAEVIRKGCIAHLRSDQEERCYGDTGDMEQRFIL